MKVLTVMAVLLLLLSGCGGGQMPAGQDVSQPSASAAAPNGSEPLQEQQSICEWPENAYTQSLPQPQWGVPDYEIQGSDSYAVFYQDIARTEGEAYVEQLIEEGFSVEAESKGEDSAGFLLTKDGVNVGVSISEGVMGLYVTL